MTEQWDAYLRDGTCTNYRLYRDQPIPKGYYHLVVEAIIQHADGDLLFVQRDAHKPSYPNYYECSAGGSALAGEIAEQAIRRETLEETGLSLEKLTLFQTFINDEHQCYVNCFLATTNQDKASVQLQTGETSHYVWVNPADLAEFLEKALVIPRHKATLLNTFLQAKRMKKPSFSESCFLDK